MGSSLNYKQFRKVVLHLVHVKLVRDWNELVH